MYNNYDKQHDLTRLFQFIDKENRQFLLLPVWRLKYSFFVFFFSLVIVVITYGLVAPRSCDYNVGALELDGYTSGRATDVSEFYL